MTKSQFPIKSKNINPKERLEGVTVCPPGTLRAALRAGGFVGHWALGFGVFLFLLAAPFVVFVGVVSAEDARPAATPPTYERLAPLPLPTIAVGEGLSGYLKTLFWLTISAAGVLAVLMITVGGVQYMLSEAFNTKADAKNRITMAIFGFLLAISSVLILQTINPELLQFKLLTRLSDLKSSLVFDLSAPSGVLTESPTKPGCSTLADFFGSVVQSCSWIHSKAAGNISACRYTIGELQAAGGGGSFGTILK